MIKISYQSETDIGGGVLNMNGRRENQDDYFNFEKDEILIFGMIDGHGKKGKIIANFIKINLLQYFETNYINLLTIPVKCISDAFEFAQKQTISYLQKMFFMQEIYGGATCSLICIVNGIIYSANVGDSTALLCTEQPILTNSLITYEGDMSGIAICTESDKTESDKTESDKTESDKNIENKYKYIELTCNHKPDNLKEFKRIQQYATIPGLNFFYDVCKPKIPNYIPIFTFDEDNIIHKNTIGEYYNTVRNEYACIVSIPGFQNSLSMTRSLIDVQYGPYGIHYLPEITSITISKIFEIIQNSEENLSTDTISTDTISTDTISTDTIATDTIPADTKNKIYIVLASDGVWDNWQYSDVSKFVINNDITTFMKENAKLAKKHFGASADNATATIICIELR